MKKKFIIISYYNRPEKDHQLQLQSLSCLLSNYPNFRQGPEKVELILIGGSRNKDDKDRIQKLKEQCKNLNIEVNIFLSSSLSLFLIEENF